MTSPKNRAPWMKLDVDAWLSSPAIAEMLPEQEGAYMRLLCLAWKQQPPCTLPADDATLAHMSRLGSRWKKLGALVRAQFEPTEDGRLRNRKQWEVYSEMAASSERRSGAGQRGAASRWGKDGNANDNAIGNASGPSTGWPHDPASPHAREAEDVGDGEITTTTATGVIAGVIVGQPADVAILLTAAANRGITARYGEQPTPLRHDASTSYQAAEAILAAGIPLDFARDAMYTRALRCTLERPPRSLRYFVAGVTDDWSAHRAREAAAELPAPNELAPEAQAPPGRPPARGQPATLAQRAFATTLKAIDDL